MWLIIGIAIFFTATFFNQYQEKGNVKRKQEKNTNIKITPEIEKFVKQQI